MLMYYLSSFSLIPLLTARAIMPIFATALVARFGPDWGWLADAAGIQLVAGLPAWLSSDKALIILGIFTAIEFLANKSPDFRLMMELSDPAIKGLTGFFLCFQLVDGDFIELLRIVVEQGITAEYVWGHSLAYSWSFLMGWAVYYSARLRGGVARFFAETDEDDDLGLQKLWSLFEDFWGFFGILFVIIMPIVALITASLALLFLYLFRKYLIYREEKQKLPCGSCGHLTHPCAVACPSCKQEREQINRVGIMGITKRDLVTDLEEHRFGLRAGKRCISCGERLAEKKVHQSCRVCATAPFASRAELGAYVAKINERLPKILLICLLISFIPLVGLIPGIIYYRINLLSSLRAYIPLTVGCFTRWSVRLLNILLISLQWIPVFGAVVLPIMAWTNYLVYRSVFKREAERGFAAAAPAPAT